MHVVPAISLVDTWKDVSTINSDLEKMVLRQKETYQKYKQGST